ncbi:MAG: 2-polyprenyl-3-methyl-5-hydroxy-6-metoxy-1,4-benzoquinol methylase, partial [Bacteroidia bacterium]
DAVEFDYFKAYPSPVTQDEINRLHQHIARRIPKSAKLIMDIGCGNGWLSKRVVNETRSLISMDIGITNPQKALDNLKHPNHYGLVADVYSMPIKNNSIDCIVASEIIEHVANPKVFIEKLLDPLIVGGKIIITTPFDERIEYHLCVHCNKPTPENAHLHRFNSGNVSSFIPSNAKKWSTHTFGNKYVAKMRLYLLIRRLPFGLWNALDKLANFFINKPTRFMIIIEK